MHSRPKDASSSASCTTWRSRRGGPGTSSCCTTGGSTFQAPRPRPSPPRCWLVCTAWQPGSNHVRAERCRSSSTGRSPMPLPEVTLPRTSEQTLHHAGADYRLLLGWPDEPAPVDGYPIIYALDADATFAMLVSLVRQRSRRPDATGVPPSVVAALGLAPSHADRTRRTWDFTPAGLAPPSGEWPSGAEPRTGGAPALLDWLTGEVRQVAERGFPIDPTRRTIVGHSLGGFFVVDALLSGPE